jgi:hypothetical protein
MLTFCLKCGDWLRADDAVSLPVRCRSFPWKNSERGIRGAYAVPAIRRPYAAGSAAGKLAWKEIGTRQTLAGSIK